MENKGEAMHEEHEHESIMDHCALECMRAIENKDKSMFREAFHVLVGDILERLGEEMEEMGEDNV